MINDIMRKMCTLITSKGTDIDANIANQYHATRTRTPKPWYLKLTNPYRIPAQFPSIAAHTFPNPIPRSSFPIFSLKNEVSHPKLWTQKLTCWILKHIGINYNLTGWP